VIVMTLLGLLFAASVFFLVAFVLG